MVKAGAKLCVDLPNCILVLLLFILTREPVFDCTVSLGSKEPMEAHFWGRPVNILFFRQTERFLGLGCAGKIIISRQ